MPDNLKGRYWLSVAEFCALTGEKPDTVRDRCERGAYRCRRAGPHGGRWRVLARETAHPKPLTRASRQA